MSIVYDEQQMAIIKAKEDKIVVSAGAGSRITG